MRRAWVWLVLIGALGACGASRPLGVQAQDATATRDVAAADVAPAVDVASAVDVAPVTDGSVAAGADSSLGTVVPPCTSTSAASPAMDATRFCAIFLATCGTGQVGYTTLAECVATYVGIVSPHGQQCQSYHVCNAVHVLGADRMAHCGHAAGLSVCTQTN
jgi:hypothetical protein